MSNIIPFSSARRRNSDEEDRRRLQEVEDAGTHAWGHLLRVRKLSKPDRIALAKALHEEFKALREKYPRQKVGEFAVSAGLSTDRTSRDLHKYMLPPADEAHTREKQQRDLRAGAWGYCRILKAIQRKTGENIAILADRVTWATSFHPRRAKDIEESEKLLSTLQEAINRIDQHFPELSGQAGKLYDAFMRTARAKVEMRKNGSLLRWPYFDSDVPFPDLSPDDFPQHSPHDKRLEDEIDERYAYWYRDFEAYRNIGRYDYPSALSHYETITNLPRIYLGLIVDWGTADAAAKTKKRSELRKHIGEIAEKRDESTNQVKLVYRNPESGKLADSIYQNPIEEWCHAWLVIYPSPDNRSLAPAIYRPAAEGGVELIHLSHRHFLKLKDFEFITEGDAISLYERIKELMGFGTGHFEIEEAWKTTAPDVLRNPVLRAHHDKGQREVVFTSHLDKWWRAEKDGA